jgi:hypothetical protein
MTRGGNNRCGSQLAMLSLLVLWWVRLCLVVKWVQQCNVVGTVFMVVIMSDITEFCCSQMGTCVKWSEQFHESNILIVCNMFVVRILWDVELNTRARLTLDLQKWDYKLFHKLQCNSSNVTFRIQEFILKCLNFKQIHFRSIWLRLFPIYSSLAS